MYRKTLLICSLTLFATAGVSADDVRILPNDQVRILPIQTATGASEPSDSANHDPKLACRSCGKERESTTDADDVLAGGCPCQGKPKGGGALADPEDTDEDDVLASEDPPEDNDFLAVTETPVLEINACECDENIDDLPPKTVNV